MAALVGVLWLACDAGNDGQTFKTGSGGNAGGNGGGGNSLNFGGGDQGGGCVAGCSPDFHQVLDCNGVVVEQCTGLEGCDASLGICANACAAAVNNKQSVGCDFYATDMEAQQPTYCFAAFVANTWNTPVHLTVERGGQMLPVENFTRIPAGAGPALTYQPFDNTGGLPPGEVAIVFLSGNAGGAPNCPVAPAVSGDAGTAGTGITDSFKITSDVPVVVYQINPYGGGSVAVTGASLLLPTSAWDTNYVAVNASQFDLYNPSMNIVAAEDGTTVTMVPVQALVGGNGIPASPANTPVSFMLNAGQNAQISQQQELTGSIIQSDKPIGFMAGQPCMRAPLGVAYCDHGEQMVPPVQSLGNEYVGVMYRPRANEPAIWRLIGAVDDTQLTWTPDVAGPATIQQGEIVEVITGTPFVVTSQDTDHPFLMFAYMAGSQWSQLTDNGGYGDVDFVISVPPDQYMTNYVFFADPTYPETNLVVVRARAEDDTFRDVDLDCAGVLSGWQPVGDYEWTRVDLITGDFQGVGNCSTGRHEMTSEGRFGLWVWGWGTPNTGIFTANVSYGYPGGMNVQAINEVVLPPIPR